MNSNFIILVSWTVEKDRVLRTVLSKEARFRDILPILKYKLKNIWVLRGKLGTYWKVEMVQNEWMHRSILGAITAVYQTVTAAFEGWLKAEEGRWRVCGIGGGRGGGIHISETTVVQLGWHMNTILFVFGDFCNFFLFLNKPNHALRFKIYRKERTIESLVMWSTEIEGNYASVKTLFFSFFIFPAFFLLSILSNSGNVRLYFDLVKGSFNCSVLSNLLLALSTTSSLPHFPPKHNPSSYFVTFTVNPLECKAAWGLSRGGLQA